MSTKTVAKNLFLDYDADNSGYVSFCEFKSMMEEFIEKKTPETDMKIREEFSTYDTDDNNRLTVEGNFNFIQFRKKLFVQKLFQIFLKFGKFYNIFI